MLSNLNNRHFLIFSITVAMVCTVGVRSLDAQEDKEKEAAKLQTTVEPLDKLSDEDVEPKEKEEATPEPEPKPEANSSWDIVRVNERDYVSAKDIREFYRFDRLDRSGREMYFRSKPLLMKATVHAKEIKINGVRFGLSYPILEQGKNVLISRVDLCKLIDPVLRPKYIRTADYFDTVVLDPGHGGKDTGAKGIHGDEADYALDLAEKLRTHLLIRGFKVKFTRVTNKTLALKARVQKANQVKDSIFVSVHFNSSGFRAAQGLETFALSPPDTASSHDHPNEVIADNYTGNLLDSANIALATAIHASVLHKTKSEDRGIKRARFAVLKGLKKPGVLFEAGFITNPDEAHLINDPLYMNDIAESMAEGILNYRNALKKPRPSATTATAP